MCQGCNIGINQFGFRRERSPEEQARWEKRQQEEDEAITRRVLEQILPKRITPLAQQMCMFEGVGSDVTMGLVCLCPRCKAWS